MDREKVLKGMVKYYFRDFRIRDFEEDAETIKKGFGQAAKHLEIPREELLEVVKELIVEMLDSAQEKVLALDFKK